jgi:hypothetical protein
MIPLDRTLPAEAFRAAVVSKDLTAIDAALVDYLVWFRSNGRDLTEAAKARDLMEWGLEAVAEHRTGIANRIALLQTLSAAYWPHRAASTWGLDA